MPRKIPTTPRKLPQQNRSKVTVDAILTATARILTEEGYDKASTNRIAELAGVSIGSLYQYFPNKEALVAALAAQHTNEMVELVKSKSRLKPQNLDLTVFILGRTVESLCHAAVIECPELLSDGQLEQEITNLLLSYLLEKTS